jgi:hypothetical protein
LTLTATATWPRTSQRFRGRRHAFHAQRLTSTGALRSASALDHGHVAVAVAVHAHDNVNVNVNDVNVNDVNVNDVNVNDVNVNDYDNPNEGYPYSPLACSPPARVARISLKKTSVLVCTPVKSWEARLPVL